MSRKKTFDDGSYVEWVDRETLKYTSGDFSVLVWVDFEPGLFSGGRIIKASSIKNWDAKPAGSPATIDEDIKQDIINKIQQYYKSFKKKYRVEKSSD
ncbi:hypothetical protein [Desulforhabdus amnigena]|jgi:hypothetical protein|uniref:Uncharacterized protein n=1 Tax=Desulforhabdus amnigena TaxID=40218 RepID=A0A9W6D4H2_9BACT|nr:hypothetical protein [Desulforhabdus amnigena]GLI34002.1 hypothetical protein DAMNIGENAA_14350 [Desulforhabdus amnigena]